MKTFKGKQNQNLQVHCIIFYTLIISRTWIINCPPCIPIHDMLLTIVRNSCQHWEVVPLNLIYIASNSLLKIINTYFSLRNRCPMKAAKAATAAAISAFFMAAMFRRQKLPRNSFRVYFHSCTTDGAKVCVYVAVVCIYNGYLLKTSCSIPNWHNGYSNDPDMEHLPFCYTLTSKDSIYLFRDLDHTPCVSTL